MTTGAHALLDTLIGSGVQLCCMNPGTSEMHLVAALDDAPGMRGVLALFEGVASGVADGWARMTGTPAAVLTHLGPGLGNALANLHNARRAQVPVVSIVGDHATTHRAFDAPLSSDIETVARNVSRWVRTAHRPEDLGRDVAEAVAAAYGPPGEVATLIVPADVSWSDGAQAAQPLPLAGAHEVSTERVEHVARLVRAGERVTLLIGGNGLGIAGIRAASRIAATYGVKLLAPTFPTRLERGAGRPEIERLSYLGDFARLQLDGTQHLVLIDSPFPVTFFGYPGANGDLVPQGCEVHVLAEPGDDAAGALERLAHDVGAAPFVAPNAPERPAVPSGPLDAASLAAVIGALLPADAIVSDEAQTSGLFIPGATLGAPPHTWLTLTGGAIGQGLPVATGAALACPGRRVVSLEADGSAMYTPQALWTQAREGLDVTTVIAANRSYAILDMELARLGVEAPRAREMFDLTGPELDFVRLAEGFGVPATRVTTAEEFAAAFGRSVAEPGPHLIEALVPPLG